MTDADSIANLVANLDADLVDDEIFHELDEDQEDDLTEVNNGLDEQDLNDDDDPIDYTQRIDAYMELLRESCDRLSKIDGGYKGRIEREIDKRKKESDLYCEVVRVQKVGGECNLQEVNKKTSRMSWLGSTGIYGPAWRRAQLRRPKVKIRGLTDEEARRVNKNRSDRALWNKILGGIEAAKEEDHGETLGSHELQEIALKHFRNGDFHLLRKIPSNWQQQLSLNRWSRGIFYPWDLEKGTTQFPYRPAIDTKTRPSANVIKDYVAYSRYQPYDVTTNQYTHLSGASDMKEAFTVHWRQRCLEKADKALAEAKVKKEEKRIAMELEAKVLEKQKKKDLKNKVILGPSASTLPEESRVTFESLGDEYEAEERTYEEEGSGLEAITEEGDASVQSNMSRQHQDPKKSKKSIFKKLPWGKGKEEEEESAEGMALVPLDEGSHFDSQTIGTMHHSHAGDSAADDAEEMNDGSASLQNGVALEGDEIEGENPESFDEGVNQGSSSTRVGRSTSGSALTPLGKSRKYKDTPRRDNEFFKRPHPAEAKGRLKSEAARQKMKKKSFIHRLSNAFTRSNSIKIKPSATNDGSKDGTTDDVNSKGAASETEGTASEVKTVEGGTTDGMEESKSDKKKDKKKTTKIVGRRFESSTASGGQGSGLATGTAAASGSNGTGSPKKKKKGEDGIVRTKNSAFAVATSTPPLKKKRKKKKDDDNLPPLDEPNLEDNSSVWEKAKKKLKSGQNAYSEFKVKREKEQEYKNTMFGAAPSVADKRLVETLCTVRALQRGTARRLRILLKIFTLGILGADPERDSYTPEHLKQAALFGHYNKVVDILDHWSEVSPNDRCEEGDTPFIAAVIRALEGEALEDEDFTMDVGFVGMINKVKKWYRKRKRNPGKLDLCVKILDNRGGDVNVLKVDRGEGDGYGLIHIAAERNIVDLAKWLNARQVDVQQPSAVLKRTALMVAARKGHGDMVHRLLHMGAIDTINHQDADGWTALHCVAAYCEPEYVEMMLICGADPSVRHKGNRLPLEEAQMRGRLEQVQAIMAYKDRTHAYRHQISYLNDEVKQGRTGSQDDASVSIAGSVASGLASLTRSVSMGGKHFVTTKNG